MKGVGAEDSEGTIATALVRRIEGGDTPAEGDLFRRYSKGLLVMLRQRTGDPDLADDLHQEAFRIVLERIRKAGLQDPSRLGGFLYRTARNLVIADYRKKNRRKDESLDEVNVPTDPAAGQLRQVLLDEEAALVRQVIEELKPERDRELLYRFYLLEEEKDSICTELDLTSLHFNRVLHRAHKRFKDLLERSRKRQNLPKALAILWILIVPWGLGGNLGEINAFVASGIDQKVWPR